MAALRCPAGRLTEGTWCRFRLGTYPGGPFRKVASVHRTVSGAVPMVTLTFSNGEMVDTPVDAMWEIDMEIDQ